jgi:membrane-bound lytic murein transglycosylase D
MCNSSEPITTNAMRILQSAALLVIGLTLAIANSTASSAAPAEQSFIQLVTATASGATAGDPTAESPTLASSTEMSGFPVDISTPSVDLWERIRNGFAMAELNSIEVRNSENLYAGRPEYINRIVERSRRYLFHIVEEVERRGMPTEIALLPIIESAFNPTAYSRSHASGIWQFIPSTGKNYGLQQNWWHDDRRDIVAATNAALDYLQNLHRMFGDWELALASYNWGEGAVGRSLARNRNNGLPTDFSSIRKPSETRNYVPKLIAMRNIISNPAAFGIVLESIPNQPYFEQVATTQHIDVKLAASLADISMDEFNALNPAHNRPVINVNGSRTLLLPVDKVETFTANLENHDKPLVSWQAYQAKRGETADRISARQGISVARLREVNGIARHGKIAPGQTLLVPLNSNSVGMDISVMRNMPAARKIPERSLVYTVKNGDTLSIIAKRHGVSVAQIQSWNSRTERLAIGQKLAVKQVPSGKTHLARAPSKKPAALTKKNSVILLADANKYGR